MSNKYTYKINNKEILNHINIESLVRCYNCTKDKRIYFSYFNNVKNYNNLEEAFMKFLDFTDMYKPTPQDGLYNKNYISLKYNVSLDEADLLISSKKKNKTTNLEGFILRHGVNKGIELFNNFKITSKKSYNKLLELSDEDRLLFYRKNSVRCYEYYLEKQLASTVEEALHLANMFQKNNSGVNYEYYKSRGYADNVITLILEKLNKSKTCSYEVLKEKYPDCYLDKIKQRRDKLRKSLGCIELTDDYFIYIDEVNQLTEITCKLYSNKIEDYNLRSRSFHLDHKFSKHQGFVNNIPAWVIAHYENLEIKPASINCSKKQGCSIDKEQLIKLTKNNNYFNLYEN